MRVVHDRLRRARDGPDGPRAALPGGRPVPAARRGAGARGSARARLRAGRLGAGASAIDRGDDARAPGRRCRTRRTSSGARGRAVAGGVARGSAISRLAADHLRLRQDVHLLHRPVQPRPGAQPAVRRDRRRGARPGRGRLPRGHATRPERQLVRARPGAGGAIRACRRRSAEVGRRLDLTGARISRSSSARSTACAPPTAARHPAAAVRHVAPVGPVRPAHRGDGRLPVGVRGAAPAGPVGRRRVLRRMGRQYTIEHYLERLARIREAVPRSRSRPTSSSASAARPRPSSSRRSGCSSGPLRPGLRRGLLASGPARPRRTSPTTCPPPRSAAG